MLLSCKNIKLGYGKKMVLNDVTFQISEGDYLCIVGENGAGKSTLIKTMLGLMEPLSGKIVFGEELESKEIGYLPQSSYMQRDFPASCKEVVLSGCINHCGILPFYGKKQKTIARNNMKKLGVEYLADRCFSELSGGQQQRILLARALCATEKLLILDEPVTGLDAEATADMYAIIHEINKQGVSIVMITHDIMGALQDATHIIEILHGKFSWESKEQFVKRIVSLQGKKEAEIKL